MFLLEFASIQYGWKVPVHGVQVVWTLPAISKPDAISDDSSDGDDDGDDDNDKGPFFCGVR